MSEPVSGFATALAALGEAGVDFVVVGVGDINFYARTPADAFATLDVDALLEPASENLQGGFDRRPLQLPYCHARLASVSVCDAGQG